MEETGNHPSPQSLGEEPRRSRRSRLWQAENVFLLLGLVFGLIFMVVTVPSQVPDENQHFFRAYAVSKGALFAKEGILPKSVYALLTNTFQVAFNPNLRVSTSAVLNYLYIPLRSREQVAVRFPNVGVYSPLPYLPQALGCLVGRIFQFSPLLLFWSARLFNLLCWLLVCYIGLRITPIFKWVFLTLMLLPMSITQAASVSADSMSNALGFLTLAVCLYFAFNAQNTLTWRNAALLLGLSAALALCKAPYVFLMGLYLLIPIRKYGTTRRFIFFSAALVAVSLLFFTASISIGKDDYVQGFQPEVTLDTQGQTNFIIQHPRAFLKIVDRTFRSRVGLYWQMYVGILGWLNVWLPRVIYPVTLVVLLIMALFDHGEQHPLSLFQRLVLLGAPAASMMVVYVALFITWTQPKTLYIEGFQGRYLIPILPPVFVLLYNTFRSRLNQLPAVLGPAYIAVILPVAIISLINRFYLY